MALQELKNFLDVVEMISGGALGVHTDIVYEHHHFDEKQRAQNLFNKSLRRAGCVGESKGHDQPLK